MSPLFRHLILQNSPNRSSRSVQCPTKLNDIYKKVKFQNARKCLFFNSFRRISRYCNVCNNLAYKIRSLVTVAGLFCSPLSPNFIRQKWCNSDFTHGFYYLSRSRIRQTFRNLICLIVSVFFAPLMFISTYLLYRSGCS